MARCLSVSFPDSILLLLRLQLAVSWEREACRQTSVCRHGDSTVSAHTGHRLGVINEELDMCAHVLMTFVYI